MNIQRNIFAGLLIFLVFLSIPIYLNFIGIGENDSADSIIDKYQEEPDSEPIINLTPDKIQPVILDNFNSPFTNLIINTDYYRMVLSAGSGGSILLYQLTEKNEDLSYKYLGSYDSNHVYSDSLNVTLVNNLGMLSPCSPCVLFNGKSLNWRYQGRLDSIYVAPGEMRKLEFSWGNIDTLNAWKTIIIDGDGYDFESVYNYDFDGSLNVDVSWETGLLPTEMGDADVYESHSSAYVYQGGELESITQNDDEKIDNERFDAVTDWAAIRNKYFAVVIVPNEPADYAVLSSTPDFPIGFNSENFDAFKGREITPIYTATLGNKNVRQVGALSFNTYIGPLDIDHISLLDSNVESIMNFGWSILKPFSRFVLWFIKILHFSLGINYGFVLILIAIIMRVVMSPLTRKSAESSAKMQKVAPLQKKLQKKYKDNPQQLQKEMSKLWKEHGVNPISGCLPLLVQWPVLMAFFIVFRSTVEFRGQPFIFWITDLSQPDYIFSLPFSVPLYGSAVAVLPIVMGISMFLTMSITMQDNSQKSMMYFMNAFFVLIFNSFPSGLTLYYTMFNLLSYQQQLSIKKNSLL